MDREEWLRVRSLPHAWKKMPATVLVTGPRLNRRALRRLAAIERTREDISDEAADIHRLPRRDWLKLLAHTNKAKRRRARLRFKQALARITQLNAQVWV